MNGKNAQMRIVAAGEKVMKNFSVKDSNCL
jgi:hypothetical protein